MKAKHIITTCGILLGGIAATTGASAVVTYRDSADVQFTFSSSLSLTLDSGSLTIASLLPDTAGDSDPVTATVITNNPSGYLLTATVGNDTSYKTTDLVSSNGQRFAMISTAASTLPSGTWGIKVDSATDYIALSNIAPTTLKQTSAATPGGGDTTAVKIGAKAAANQLPGTYNNVVNFTAVTNVMTHTITVAGSNTSSVTPSAAASYTEGDVINISATCASGYVFSNWGNSTDYGLIANPSSASTTYTVGGDATTLTAYCVADS